MSLKELGVKSVRLSTAGDMYWIPSMPEVMIEEILMAVERLVIIFCEAFDHGNIDEDHEVTVALDGDSWWACESPDTEENIMWLCIELED